MLLRPALRLVAAMAAASGAAARAICLCSRTERCRGSEHLRRPVYFVKRGGAGRDGANEQQCPQHPGHTSSVQHSCCLEARLRPPSFDMQLDHARMVCRCLAELYYETSLQYGNLGFADRRLATETANAIGNATWFAR